MAWSHRSQAPFISALASDTDVDGSTIRVQMIPRSFWDEDPRLLDTYTAAQREGIRTLFGETSFFLQHGIRVYAFHQATGHIDAHVR